MFHLWETTPQPDLELFRPSEDPMSPCLLTHAALAAPLPARLSALRFSKQELLLGCRDLAPSVRLGSVGDTLKCSQLR